MRQRGRRGLDPQSAFETAYGVYIDESSVFAHEGRHAIDRTLGLANLGAAELEYRAKLSEVAFAPHPRLALAGILDAPTGDSTPHGLANARLARRLLDWMAVHGAANARTGHARLLDIPRLTDAQIIAAMRSLDPLAAVCVRRRGGMRRGPTPRDTGRCGASTPGSAPGLLWDRPNTSPPTPRAMGVAVREQTAA
ncbi:MAG: hypothetical protein ABJE47_18525 [bacterium]